MKFKEVMFHLLAGKVALLPGWHEEQGLAFTGLGFEWVKPAWVGFKSDGTLAHIDPEMEASKEWKVIGDMEMNLVALPSDIVRKAVDFLEESQWTHQQEGDGERVYCRCCEKGAITNYFDKSIRTPKHKPECELLTTITALKTALESIR